MKKNYIIPKSTLLSLDAEDMIALSNQTISTDKGDEFDTRKQESGNSLWDSWSN